MKIQYNSNLENNSSGSWCFRKKKKRLLLLLVTVYFLNIFNALAAQTITLNEQRTSLRTVLEKIIKQSGFDLIGDVSALKNSAPITINVKNETLSNVLKMISSNQSITLELVNNTILVSYKKRKTSGEKSLISESIGQKEYVLTGKIVDIEGKAISGASVKVVKSGLITSSNTFGNFTINVLPSDQLQITLVGHERRIVDIDSKIQLHIVLKEASSTIEEVVATGYTRINKEAFTGAAKTITRQEIEKFNNNNIFSILQALDPAFKISDNNELGSNPNALPEINIRGVASVGAYAVNAPLVILDGFEVALTTLYDMDINRIESIAILKDASSTSLYGSRGSNGVIVIETRMPKDGKFTVTYDAKPSITKADLSDYNMMNAKEKLEYEKLAGIYDVTDFNSADAWDQMTQEMYDNLYAQRQNAIASGVDTYWLSQPIKSTISVNHSIRMEGGANDVRYSIEGNYNDFKGIMKESGRTRGGAGFNLIYRIPNKITFNNRATYQYTKAYESPYGSFQRYVQMNPYERIHDDNGNLNVRYAELGPFYTFGPTTYNPLYDATLGFRDDSRTHFISNNMSIDWMISQSFRVKIRGVLSRSINDKDKYTSPYHSSFFGITDQSRKGQYQITNGNETQFNSNLTLEYNKNINKHQIFSSLIGEIRADDLNNKSYFVTGFNDDRFISPSLALQYAANSVPLTESNPIRSVSLLGSINYSYDNRYNLSGTLTSDGSSLFGQENRFGTFWSLGASYNLHNEKWFENKYVNRFRVFGNVGTNGSQNFNGDMLNTAYRFLSGSYYYNQYSSIYVNQGNPNVRWPVVEQISVGTSLGLFRDLIGLDFNYYEKTTNNMISDITVAPSFGFAGNSFVQNLGKVSNTGFEINTNFRLYQNLVNEFSWYVAIGAVQNKSILLEISNELRQYNESLIVRDASGNIRTPSTYYEEGVSLNTIRGVRSLGIDPANGRELFRDRDGNVTYVWNALDQERIGDGEAKLFGNISSTINYKRLSVQLIGNYSLGQDIYNETLVNKVENNSPFENADKRVLEDRWKTPGDLTKYKSISDQSPTQVSSRFVQSEKRLVLTTINVNYDFSKSIISRYNLERLRFNFSTNDALRLSNIRMERGIDYPFARTYNFGVLVQF
ncbi:SusC/RagA family TonB-linked outer membrane protein [Sphingobacterium bovistauri]|uniref:SusC/RagA family TonB-linked outer membrane protein n=1 Tax=Sphingobacterium bovistauri TaxID=2781959 RepID=A0ABS7Z969_9SPHI|nr:SusC/RagA family TonB-linked outer membrane protein [Sphingobacterium bovistauri]MCA5006742.1 SusC/RagA family TonB-linked outer membrane protein [Sphingobacterium bovistauri]